MHFSTTFGSFAVLAFAALASAIPVSNSTDPNNFGCMVDSDCRPGYACSRNICVPTPPASSTRVPPVSSSPASSAPPALGCNSNWDCQQRYPGQGAVCQHNICVFPATSSIPSSVPSSVASSTVKSSIQSAASSSVTSSAVPLGCQTNLDCQKRYPGQNAYCGPHNICLFASPSSIPVSSTIRSSVRSSIVSSKPAPSSSAIPLGCMTDKECQQRYPGQNAYCGPHNICMFRPSSSPVRSSPISSKISTTICSKSSSSTTTSSSIIPLGCNTDKDCAGRYPYPAVCQHNICVPAPPTTKTTTTTVIPPPPPPPPVGCNSDADCAGRYPWQAVCKHNICVPSHPFVPTSTIITTTTTTTTSTPGCTNTVTVTVIPPPPPYKPTTVTVYQCITHTTSAHPSSSTSKASTTSTPTAEATLFPNLIVPIKQATPNSAYGTQYTGTVSETTANNNIDSLFAFDIPFIYETQQPTCQLSFTLPAIGTGFPRTVSGTGQVDVYALVNANGMEQATWNTRPARGAYIGRIQVIDGQVAKWIGLSNIAGPNVACAAGTRIGVELVPVGQTEVEWFELKTPLTGLTLEVFA